VTVLWSVTARDNNTRASLFLPTKTQRQLMMNSNTEDTPEHLRRAIDAELKSLEKTALTLKLRRNALVPISRLPPETIAIIFSFLSLPRDHVQLSTRGEQYKLAWLRVSHVCHRWREIALNHPRFWSYIDFTTLTLAGATEVLSRSKMAPLELEANFSRVFWEAARFTALREQLVAHLSHTCRLSITAKSIELQKIVDQVVTPAPTLEWLSLTVDDKDRLPNGMPARTATPSNLFDGSAPRLSCLYLDHCDIRWTSPLFKGLRILNIQTSSLSARPELGEWLDAMDEMLKLETLVACSATPIAPMIGTHIVEPTRVITRSSLAHLHLAGSASDCAFALAHLILPALITVRIDAIAELSEGDDVRALIPHFTRNAHGPQDDEPLQSIIISGGPYRAEVILWAEPDVDLEVQNPATLLSATLTARAIFTVSGHSWRLGTDAEILDTTLAALPLGSLSGLTAHSAFSPELLWCDRAAHWPSLERVRLVDLSARVSFIEVLSKGAPRDAPLFPSLTRLSLVGSVFCEDADDIYDVLIGRVEQGVPLETLDLQACAVPIHLVKLYSEIVVDVHSPELRFFGGTRWPTLSNRSRDITLPFQIDIDEYADGDEDSDVFSDDMMINPWFHGYIDDEFEEDEFEDDDIGVAW
jgi:hypothetical protein